MINSPLQSVWRVLAELNFSWWSLVDSTCLVDGSSSRELDSTTRVIFKDGTSWVIAIRELSSINHYITFEVVSSDSPCSFSAAIHTISLKRVSSLLESTFIEWVSDFSSDATSETVIDSSYKRREAFQDLAKSVSLKNPDFSRAETLTKLFRSFFNKIDTSKSGFIESQELQRFIMKKEFENSLPERRPSFSSEEIEKVVEGVMQHIDRDQDHRLSFNEFLGSIVEEATEFKGDASDINQLNSYLNTLTRFQYEEILREVEKSYDTI